MDLERDIASFLGTEACILYSQAFSTISSVIPAFCKRGDIIVLDRGANFVIQKGAQLSRSTIRYYDHNDLESLENVLQSIEKEQKKRRSPLTRRFIVTEGLFEKDGQILDLPKLVRLLHFLVTNPQSCFRLSSRRNTNTALFSTRACRLGHWAALAGVSRNYTMSLPRKWT
jgi:hypothetical protein